MINEELVAQAVSMCQKISCKQPDSFFIQFAQTRQPGKLPEVGFIGK